MLPGGAHFETTHEAEPAARGEPPPKSSFPAGAGGCSRPAWCRGIGQAVSSAATFDDMKTVTTLTVFSCLPALIVLALFYSLSGHMHATLGGWPSSIGEHGFPASLVLHAHIATFAFSTLLLISLFLWPPAFALCIAVRRWRAAARYLAVYAVACLAGFGAILLAPGQFLYWWWD